MYIYENHMGGIYATECEQDYESLYCEQCGDSDWLIGQADTRQEAWELLRDDTNINGSGGYDYEYIRKCLDEWFPK